VSVVEVVREGYDDERGTKGMGMINRPERAKAVLTDAEVLESPEVVAECSSLVLSLQPRLIRTTSPDLCLPPPPQLEKVPQMKSLQKIQRYSARSHSQTMNFGPTQACETQTATVVSFPYTASKRKPRITQK